MKKIELWFWALATASKGNPFLSVITVMLFYVMFNLLESQLERLIFGDRFLHWADPFIALMFIAASAYSVWMCARYEMQDKI